MLHGKSPMVGAAEKCEAWRGDYNEVRPHSAVTLIERSAEQRPRRPEQAGKLVLAEVTAGGAKPERSLLINEYQSG